MTNKSAVSFFPLIKSMSVHVCLYVYILVMLLVMLLVVVFTRHDVADNWISSTCSFH